MSGLSSLSSRVAGIVREAVGVLARLGPVRPGIGPVLVAISVCIERRLRRFERLMARLRAGQPAVAPRRSGDRAKRGSGAAGGSAGGGGRRASLVPRGQAWAVKMAQGTAVFGHQLQALLAEPEAAELLRRSPEAAALLRPLCRMLAMPMLEATLHLPEPAAPTRVVRRSALRGWEHSPEFKRQCEIWAAIRLGWAKAWVRSRGPPW